jgi:ABC-2 type transport system permease protein
MTMPPTASTPLALAPVRVPPRSLRNDLRAVKIVWHRDVLRFFRDKPRIVTALLQPLLYLFVLGTGLSSVAGGGSGPGLRAFLFPGVMAMAVLFTCFFSAGSLVWDREFGFMREMMVAPVRRAAIVVGKCLGGATAGMFQGVVLLSIAGLVGVRYDPIMIVELLAELALLSFSLTAFAVLIAARIKSMQAFMALVQMLLMPLFFLSGALFPLTGLPGWLTVLTRLDPLTYAVDPMRRTVLAHVAGVHRAPPGATWGSYVVPTWLELVVVAGFALLSLAGAVWQFDRDE